MCNIYIYNIYNIYNIIYNIIYVIYIYTISNIYAYGDTTSKNKLFFPTSFSRSHSQEICRTCNLQVLKDI